MTSTITKYYKGQQEYFSQEKLHMEQAELLAVVDGYLEAVPGIVYSVQFSVHLLYTYWY